jgi:hypothetical protein
VLYFSGYSDDYDVIREGLHDSGRPFLLKPFTQADLMRKIGEVLGQPSRGPVVAQSPAALSAD